MARLEELEDYIREKTEKEQWTHAELSSSFHVRYPGKRGFSVSTTERFCSKKDIHKIYKLSDVDVDECTSEAIAKVNYVSAVANTDTWCKPRKLLSGHFKSILMVLEIMFNVIGPFFRLGRPHLCSQENGQAPGFARSQIS